MLSDTVQKLVNDIPTTRIHSPTNKPESDAPVSALRKCMYRSPAVFIVTDREFVAFLEAHINTCRHECSNIVVTGDINLDVWKKGSNLCTRCIACKWYEKYGKGKPLAPKVSHRVVLMSFWAMFKI